MPRINRPSVLALEGRTLLSASPRIDTFAVPTLASNPNQIVDGPDGDLWFTEDDAQDRPDHPARPGHRVPPADARRRLPADLSGMTAGPDGAIWAIDTANGQIDRIAHDGQVETFAIPGGRPSYG